MRALKEVQHKEVWGALINGKLTGMIVECHGDYFEENVSSIVHFSFGKYILSLYSLDNTKLLSMAQVCLYLTKEQEPSLPSAWHKFRTLSEDRTHCSE